MAQVNKVEEIKSLYVVTAIVNGEERIMIGTDQLPFIYWRMKTIKEHKIIEQLQELSNKTGICMKLKLFAELTVLDVIEPMQSDKMM
jgi:hypothetical protein